MESTTRSLATRARSIFDDLGYTVVGEGAQFRAERDWKVVQVTATAEDAEPEAEGLHCYVTPIDRANALRSRLDATECEEWALIAVDDDDEYEVVRTPPGPATPT
jgi:hypothetical protein